MQKARTLWLRGLGGRINELLLGVPVFVKVMGIALGMVVVLGAGMLWQIHQTWRAQMLRGLEQRGQRLANELRDHCTALLRVESATDIAAELQHSVAESPDLAYAIVQGTNGLILAEARNQDAAPGASQIHELTTAFGDGAHLLRVGMSTAQLDQDVAWLIGSLARTSAVIGLLGLLAAWWLTRIFTRPIEELATCARAVKMGSYETVAPVRTKDEVGELAAAFNEMTGAVAQKEAARQHLLHRVIHAGEEERKRIARELHDQTGQALTSQIAALSALETRCSEEKLCQRLRELRQQTEQTLAEVHDLAVTLRPSLLDDVGLPAALQRHCRLFAQRTGIDVKCMDLGFDQQRLPSEVELTIYRVVQEALTNAVRHGQATRVCVSVQPTQAGILATVQDNGGGFDARDWQQRCAEGNHLGLLGIEERVSLLRGELCVESTPGKGAVVYAEIPLKGQT